MYDIKINHDMNSEPWKTPVGQRCKAVMEAFTEGFKVNIILYEQPDSSTFRYRGYNIAQTMENSQRWKAFFFFGNEMETISMFLGKIDILTVCRVRWNHELQMLIDRAKQCGIPVVFDVDDLVYHLEYFPLLSNTISVDFRQNGEMYYDFWFAQMGRLELAAMQADGFIGTNPFLCETLKERFHKVEYVIPNILNTEQVRASELCREQKKGSKKTPFSLGYFSGSPTHINDFKTIYLEIMQLLKDYDDMVLDVVGHMEFPLEMKELINAGRVRFTKPVDFIKLQEKVASVDVNLVPLVDNTFTNCKSELKFFEAALVDTVTCATPTYTYANAIEHGKTGFLCRPTQWYETIRDIYEGKYNLAQINQDARAYVLQRYYGQNTVKQIEEVYDAITKELSNE